MWWVRMAILSRNLCFKTQLLFNRILLFLFHSYSQATSTSFLLSFLKLSLVHSPLRNNRQRFSTDPSPLLPHQRNRMRSLSFHQERKQGKACFREILHFMAHRTQERSKWNSFLPKDPFFQPSTHTYPQSLSFHPSFMYTVERKLVRTSHHYPKATETISDSVSVAQSVFKLSTRRNFYLKRLKNWKAPKVVKRR